MDQVRWGILSTGRIAQQFAHDIQWVNNGLLAAVSSRSRSTAQDFADQYGIPKAYGNYQDMLSDPEVDAIYVATPHTLHLQNSLDAIATGKHVLCEKPLTISPAESKLLFQQASSASVFVMEAMWTWFLPAILQAKKWVDEGRIGRIHQIKADFGYPMLPFDPHRRVYNVDLAGGCLFDMGIYPLALARLFLGCAPEDIHVVARMAPNGVDDEVSVLCRYGEGAHEVTAMLGTSFRSKLRNWAYIIGDESYIAIPDFWRAKECFLYHLDDLQEHFEDSRESIGLSFETEAAGEDILAGRQQSETVPWAASQAFQEDLAAIRSAFG